MAEFNKKSISTLKPVEFTYQFGNGKEETLAKTFIPFTNGLSYFRHEGFADAKDTIVSKDNYLILTEEQPLSNLFDTELPQECFPGEVYYDLKEQQSLKQIINIGQISSSFYLKALSTSPVNSNVKTGAYVCESNLTDELIATFDPEQTHPVHVLTPIVFTLLPLGNNKTELVANRTKRILIDREYPFTARLTEEVLLESDSDKKIFEFNYRYLENSTPEMSWTTAEVPHGNFTFRSELEGQQNYLCANFRDGVVRANGMMFNDFHINPYIFEAEFVSKEQLPYNFNPKDNYEIKYTNEPPSTSKKRNLHIKNTTSSNTHFLASCATQQIKPTENSNKAKIQLNLAMLKTNFVSNGTYFHKQT